MSNAVDHALLLAGLADALIPGDGARWPSGSQVGAHGVLATRLLDRGARGVEEVAVAVGPLAGLDAAERAAAVARFEADSPQLFDLVRNATYLAYYESPIVVAVVRSLGAPYEAMPHAKGYALPAFDPAKDVPRERRGQWIATGEVRRVDLSGLPFLAAGAGTDHG